MYNPDGGHTHPPNRIIIIRPKHYKKILKKTVTRSAALVITVL